MVMARGGVEVAHHRVGGITRLPVGAMRAQVDDQAVQQGALGLHTLVARRQHLQRHLESDGGRGMTWERVGHARAF